MNIGLEREFNINGNTIQRFITVACYLDVPKSKLISKLKTGNDKVRSNIISILVKRSVVVVNWLKNDKSDKKLSDYISFLENHNERDFLRFLLFPDVVIGTYLKIDCLNKNVVGIDEDYIDHYKKCVKDLDLGEIEFEKNEDLKKILSDKIRPKLIYFKDYKPVDDDDYETWFLKTSFNM